MHPLLHQARFLKGVAKLSQLPPDQGHEVAFAGRSNAGKSSALNAITGQRALARTSKTPGRTQQINYFLLDDSRFLVDLPGYGYARVAEAVRRRWQGVIGGYLETRRALQGLIVIMDIRRPFTDYDMQLLDWCAADGLPVHILLTKADKLGRGAARQTLLMARQRLATDYGGAARMSAQLFSALKKDGLDEVRALLANWLALGGGGQE